MVEELKKPLMEMTNAELREALLTEFDFKAPRANKAALVELLLGFRMDAMVEEVMETKGNPRPEDDETHWAKVEKSSCSSCPIMPWAFLIILAAALGIAVVV